MVIVRSGGSEGPVGVQQRSGWNEEPWPGGLFVTSLLLWLPVSGDGRGPQGMEQTQHTQPGRQLHPTHEELMAGTTGALPGNHNHGFYQPLN